MKDRIVVLKTGDSFTGQHKPNWKDFDSIYKVIEKGTTHADVGDSIKVARSAIAYIVIEQKKKETKIK